MMRDGMRSHRLDIALRETIQAHADQHHHGAQDMERILAALGGAASFYLAEIPEGGERRTLFSAFCAGIAEATDTKARDQVLAAAPTS